MAHVGPAVKRFLDAQMAAFEALILKSIDDGIQHFEEEQREKVKVDPEMVYRAQQRLRGHYMPSLIRMHNQLLQLVATADGPQYVDDWFRGNSWRLDLALDGLVWAGAEAGMAIAATAAGLEIYWELDDSVSQHCYLCPVFAEGSPYHSFLELPAWPGSGATPCSGNCRCWLRWVVRS